MKNILLIYLFIYVCCASACVAGNSVEVEPAPPAANLETANFNDANRQPSNVEAAIDETANAEAKSNDVADSHATANASRFGQPVLLGHIDYPLLKESSGVAASHRAAGVFWTHNDSGGGARLFAFDDKGSMRGVWTVGGAQNKDWEDIASTVDANGTPQLYIGDIGDNARRRSEIIVYRITEPELKTGSTVNTNNPIVNKTSGSKAKDKNAHQNSQKNLPADLPTTEPAEAIRLRYPESASDAETLMVHPHTKDVYIITKSFGTQATVYRAKAEAIERSLKINSHVTLEQVATLRLPGFFGTLLTGGDISYDGRRVVLCDYARGYELTLPDKEKSFDAIWQQPLARINIGDRAQGEAICYTPDAQALISTSENRPVTVYQIKVK